MISDHDQERIQTIASEGLEALGDGDIGSAIDAFESIQRRASK